MKTRVDIRNENHFQDETLLKRPGVTGVDVGYNMNKGKKIDELCVIVYVKKKSDVNEKETIQRQVKDMTTDVIEKTLVLMNKFPT